METKYQKYINSLNKNWNSETNQRDHAWVMSKNKYSATYYNLAKEEAKVRKELLELNRELSELRNQIIFSKNTEKTNDKIVRYNELAQTHAQKKRRIRDIPKQQESRNV